MLMKTTTLALAVCLATLAAPAVAAASSAEDDLAVVKKATSSGNGSRATAEAPPRARGKEPQWLRVRIVETGEKKASVKVNLPLALVHALGDDMPVPGCGDGEGGSRFTVGELLRALDTGESLVEIEDGESTVRIWVE
jgi:hypothetical protein